MRKEILFAMVTMLAFIGIASAACIPLDEIDKLTINVSSSANLTSVFISLCNKIDSLNTSYVNLSINYNSLNSNYTNLSTNYNALNSKYISLVQNITSNTSTVTVGNCIYMYSTLNRTYFDNKMSGFDSSIADMNGKINNLPNTYVKLTDYSALSISNDGRFTSLNSKIDTVNSSVLANIDEKIPKDYNVYFIMGFVILLIVIAAVIFIK